MGRDTSMLKRDELELRYKEFIERYPEYKTTLILDELRVKEYSQLDKDRHVYLDFTGGGLYSQSQLKSHIEFLECCVMGNPHSSNPISAFTTDIVERCRRRVLRFFNAAPEEYAVVFTANASHALKLVGEAYPFGNGDQLLLCYDNHNSVNGIREYDRARGSVTRYVPIIPPEMRVAEGTLERFLSEGGSACHKLFAFPAQSNFSGVHHPLEWTELAHEHGWDVLIDAAAFVPTNRLDLGRHHPDYVALSFYKMFGYPTGVGVLIAKRGALEKLHRPWFAGGTITVASVQADRHFLQPGSEGFEDGTLNYTSFPAVEIGLDYLDSIGVELIHTRVTCLIGWLIERLLELRHANGRPMVRLYGPADTKLRGGTVALNLYDAGGRTIDHLLVEERANERKISLRTGCFCNPGAGETALGLTKAELESCFERADARMTLEEFRQCIDTKSTGAVRISVGAASNFADINSFLDFLSEFRED
jgi:molybdenum cofactor sulfurtransferase